MSKIGKGFKSSHMELTLAQEKCLVKHSREIFTKLVQVGPGLTEQNVKGIRAAAETAIELAELFQLKLMEKSYGIRTEEGQLGVPPRESELRYLEQFGQSASSTPIQRDGVRAGMGKCGASSEETVRKEDDKS